MQFKFFGSVFSVEMLLKLLVLFLCASPFLADESLPKLYNTIKVDRDGEVSVSPLVDPYDGISYRLPNDTIPLTYDIWLSTDIHRGEFDFDGRVMIQFQVVKATPVLTLQYRQMTIQSVHLFKLNEGLIQSDVPFIQNATVEFLIIRPTLELVQGDLYTVLINYSGTIRDDALGIYRASYIDQQGNTVWLATTQFQANEARHAFPW